VLTTDFHQWNAGGGAVEAILDLTVELYWFNTVVSTDVCAQYWEQTVLVVQMKLQRTTNQSTLGVDLT
jgi:hypothetical protein